MLVLLSDPASNNNNVFMTMSRIASSVFNYLPFVVPRRPLRESEEITLENSIHVDIFNLWPELTKQQEWVLAESD